MLPDSKRNQGAIVVSFEAHDLRIHPGGIDHQDEYQDTTNVPKCTEITAARPGQGLNDPSASGT